MLSLIKFTGVVSSCFLSNRWKDRQIYDFLSHFSFEFGKRFPLFIFYFLRLKILCLFADILLCVHVHDKKRKRQRVQHTQLLSSSGQV